MPLTRPRPRNTDAIVEIIRREATRPELSDVRPFCGNHSLRIGLGTYCPMGLCPKARHATPGGLTFFPYSGISNDQVVAFSNHWDEQTDKAAAVRSVWGDK